MRKVAGKPVERKPSVEDPAAHAAHAAAAASGSKVRAERVGAGRGMSRCKPLGGDGGSRSTERGWAHTAGCRLHPLTRGCLRYARRVCPHLRGLTCL